MELRQYIAIGLKWWWLMALLTGVAAATSYMVSIRQTPVYEATTTLIVGQSIQATQLESTDIFISERLARTYANMARRQPVLQAVVETLSLVDTWKELRERVRISPVSDTQLLEIVVEAHSSDEAQITADEIAHQLILLSPTTLQNQERNETLRFTRQRIENLQEKIKAGEERIESLETVMVGSLSAQQVQEIQSEINTLENLIAGWENSHSELLIFIQSEKSPNYLAIIEPAQVSLDPIRPRTKLNTLLAGVVGLLLALGLIFLWEYMDDTLKAADDLSQTLGLTTLGAISRMGGKRYQDKHITTQDIFSPAAEAYRMIRSNIQFMSVDQPVKSIMITSSTPGEGKSTTVANMGVVMAQAGLKTVIVDADLRRPVQHQIFQIPHLGGLTELLRTPELNIESYMRKAKMENLYVLTSGELPPNPAELLGSQRMRQLLDNLNDLADVVIYDSPPVLMVADAAVLSNRVDGVVLIIDAGRTRRDVARQAIAGLQQADANVLGGVLNRVPKKQGGRRYYQSYYSTGKHVSAAHPTRPGSRRRWQWLSFFYKGEHYG